MSAIVSLAERRREAAVRMAASGAPFKSVERRYGYDNASYARALIWQREGKNESDEAGRDCWIRVFGEEGDYLPPVEVDPPEDYE